MNATRRTIATAAVCLALSMAAFALSPNDLSSEARAKFDSQALTIQTSESINYYTNYWGTSIYWDIMEDLADDNNPLFFWLLPYSVMAPATYTTYADRIISWEPYRGFSKISKYEFYNDIGLPQEAERYRRFQSSVAVWNGISWGSLVAGTGFLIACLCVDDPLSSYFLATAGAMYATSSIGFTVLRFGLVEEREFSVSFAVNAAKTYNQRLLEDLGK